MVWPKLKAIGERADLVVHYVRKRNLLHRPSMARDRSIAKALTKKVLGDFGRRPSPVPVRGNDA